MHQYVKVNGHRELTVLAIGTQVGAIVKTFGPAQMAIYRLLREASFGPDEISRMTAAYEEALRVLGLIDRSDPATETLARKIIEVARRGEQDSSRICAMAIKELAWKRQLHQSLG